MAKTISVEVDGVFYNSLKFAGRVIGCNFMTVKKRCLSDDFPNYKFVPFPGNYTEKRCRTCGKIKLLSEFHVQANTRDGLRNSCNQCRAEGKKEWKKENREQIRERDKEYNNTHKKERNAGLRKKKETDPAFRINESMSKGINRSLKNSKGGAYWETLVDYDLEKLIVHLESLFTEGMSWKNYGSGKYKWNIDHVIAKSKFNITSAECQEFIDCWALKNLQPLWDVRNKEKRDRPMEPKHLIKPF